MYSHRNRDPRFESSDSSSTPSIKTGALTQGANLQEFNGNFIMVASEITTTIIFLLLAIYIFVLVQ